MKLLPQLALLNLLYFTAVPTFADDNPGVGYQTNGVVYDQQANNNNNDPVAQYLLNLGTFLGYNLSQPATQPPNQPSQALLNPAILELTQNYAVNTFLGAFPVDAISTALAQFMATSLPGAKPINKLANATFVQQQYNAPSAGQSGTVTASSLIDQLPDGDGSYLPDPVSQSLFNILGTPDATYCMNNDASAWIDDCSLLYQNKVINQVLGSVPTTDDFFSYTTNQTIISQLNSNTLLAPLMYSTEPTVNVSPSRLFGTPNVNNKPTGLTAQSQAQVAGNFIRYVSGAVVPLSLAKRQEYDKLYTIANPRDKKSMGTIQQIQAQSTLSTYLNNLRIYAAQSSVGMSNLYSILSKRLPQSQDANNTILTSQAMNEFNMATWRLFNPQNISEPNKQWIAQLSGASSATIQKEIAVLLAEINYQMYLDRQIQERILLTNTVLLMQNLKASQPSADISSQGSN